MTEETNNTPVEEAAPAAAPAPAPEPKAEAKEEAKAEASKEVPAKFKKIVDEIESMSVLDLNELVKVFEDKFDVSATAVAAAGPASAGPAEDEKSTVNVELTDSGANKIAVIKVVKEAAGLGLKEAKDLVDGAPSIIKTDVKKEDAEALKKALEEAGGKVSFK